MKTFFWFCLALLIPGLLLRIPVGGVGILATDIVVPIFSSIWIFKKIVIDQNIPHVKFVLPAGVFLLVALLSFVWGGKGLDNINELFFSFSYIIRFVSMILFGWAAVDLFQTNKDQQKFFSSLAIIASIVVFLGFLQFFIIPDISGWSTEGGWDPHNGRLLGTWLDPNFMGGFIGFLTPFLIAQWYESKKGSSRTLLSFLILLFLVALFLTFSRSASLSAVIGLFIFFSIRDPKIILIGIVSIFFGIASSERAQQRVEGMMGTFSSILLNETDEIDPTASLRLESWTQSLSLWEKNKIIGIGYNTYRYRASEEGIVDENYFSSGGSDSTHLTILITTGILGFIPFLWFFGLLIWNNFRLYFQKKNTLFLGYACGVLTLFIHGFFVNSLFFPFIFIPLIALAGVLENKANL